MSTPNPLQPGGPYTNPINGQPSSSPGSPGVSGALKDALAAIFMAIAPKSLTQRKQALQSQEAAGVGAPAQASPPGLGSEF